MNYDGPKGGGSGAGPEKSGALVPLVLSAEAGQAILLPDSAWILGGDYIRQGGDLVIKGADGQMIVVRDFFNLATPPDLHTGTGAVINGPLAVKLAGPLAPGQTAQASPQASPGEPIGKVTAADGTVEATRVDGTKVRLKEGDPVFQGDVVETAKDGAVGIEFVDESTFSLGDSGRMVLDEMVYDPGGGSENNSFAMSLVQGTFSFVSGQISKTDPEAMSLNTPVATIGIRGTTIAGEVGGEGNNNSISLLPDPTGSTGEIVITNEAGTVVLNVIGATITVTSISQPPPQPIILSSEQLSARYDNVLAINPAGPQVAPQDGQEEGDLPQDVLDQLQDIGEQLNKAVQEGLNQAQQFGARIENLKLGFEELLRPPVIDPLPFLQKIIGEVTFDTDTVSKLSALSEQLSGATTIAGEAEGVASQKITEVRLSVSGLASDVGISTSNNDDYDSLVELAIAPFEAFGAAAAVSTMGASLSTALDAATTAAGNGEAISTALYAELLAGVQEMEAASAKMLTIVTAIAGNYTESKGADGETVYTFNPGETGAADNVLDKVKAAANVAKIGGGDVSAIITAAKNEMASQYETQVVAQLAANQSNAANPVLFDDLSGIVTDVSATLGRIETEAQGVAGLQILRDADDLSEDYCR
ncbi:MAG: hypothetical protein HOH04_15710 [Rhodospirillaceae bacterium]|nr:hypothetical protein [Rhodospirillaceae bacterium]